MSLCVCVCVTVCSLLGKNNELNPSMDVEVSSRCHRRDDRCNTRGGHKSLSFGAAIAAKLCESAAQAKGCLALAAEPQKLANVPVFSDTQIERMGVTSNLYRFLLALFEQMC